MVHGMFVVLQALQFMTEVTDDEDWLTSDSGDDDDDDSRWV